jgi:outer membrane protein TolC
MALTAQVTRASLRVLATGGVLDAEVRHTEALAAEGRRVEQLLEQGRAARVELLRVQAALAQAEAARLAMATRLDLAERDLARLVDLPPDAVRTGRLRPVQLAAAGAVRERTAEERSTLIEQAHADNPDVVRARGKLEAAEAAWRVTRGAWFPKVDAFGAYLGYGSAARDGALEWQAGLSLSYPLFTAGSRSSAVTQAAAQAEAAREEVRLAELQAEADLDRALNALLEARSLVEAVTLAVQHQTEVARIEQLSLQAGAGTQTDYLRAESELLRERSALVEAEHAEIAAHVELARAVGELTPEWIDRSLRSGR